MVSFLKMVEKHGDVLKVSSSAVFEENAKVLS